MQITFCGAAGEVTGSAHLLTLANGFKILLDCGMYQGHRDDMQSFNITWRFNPSEIDVLIVSHAHIDHIGRIPKLVKDGFSGAIICTPATRDLAAIMLSDAAAIQEKDAAYYNEKRSKGPHDIRQPLYTEEDVFEALKLFHTVPYERLYTVRPGIDLLFRDAGHILGSASVWLSIAENGTTTRVAFTGDIGRPNRPILEDPKPMEAADIIICESTYGDRLHDEAPEEFQRFAQIVRDTIERRGKVIIPAFSLGRTQELVYHLDQMFNAGILPRIPVYVDSPLSVNATDIFRQHPECFDADLSRYLLHDPDPFGFNSLVYVRDVEESKRLNSSTEPIIIISSSGMGNAGRVKHHLFNSIDQARNTVLIVGFATPETPVGHLRTYPADIRLFGVVKPVRARIEILDSFSAHGDQREMSAFLANQRASAKKVFLVHGSPDRLSAWKQHLQIHVLPQAEIEIPRLGQSFNI